MCQPLKLLTVGAALAVAVWSSDLQAAFLAVPRAVKNQLNQLRLDLPVLAPMAHVRFCLRYHEECEVRQVDFRRRNIALTPKRWNELNAVNRKVNREIVPEPNLGGVMAEEWLLSPKAGDCNDYAVTKRHILIAHGWPSRALLLSEVVTPSGQHHLLLVVRTKNADLVLDNLSANVRPVSTTYRQYKWVRIESPQNPRFWASVRIRRVLHLAGEVSPLHDAD
jgi:predicted transglutaminase-like cysteine proteinase